MMKKALMLSALVLGLSACGGGSNPADPGKESKSGTYTYTYTVNGCATGVHTSASLKDYCLDLADDALNNNCAEDVRCETFNDECKSLNLGITCD